MVWFPGALGDLLLALPALRQLARDRPVTIACGPARALLEDDPGLAVRPGEGLELHRLLSPAPARPAALRGFGTIWVPAVADARLDVAGVRVYALPPRAARRPPHAALRYRDAFCPGARIGSLRLVPPVAARRRAARTLAGLGLAPGRYATLHPGSGAPAKCWPGWNAVAAALAPRPVLLLAGPAERDRPAALPPGPRAVDRPLPDVAALLALSAVHAGNDSGISHLAAAVGTTTLAVFGPTSPAVWAPWSPHAETVRWDPADPLALVERVVDALRRRIEDR